MKSALRKNKTPEIFNTDQRAQYTGKAFIGELKDQGVQISILNFIEIAEFIEEPLSKVLPIIDKLKNHGLIVSEFNNEYLNSSG